MIQFVYQKFENHWVVYNPNPGFGQLYTRGIIDFDENIQEYVLIEDIDVTLSLEELTQIAEFIKEKNAGVK
jgi:hypothetical protein